MYSAAICIYIWATELKIEFIINAVGVDRFRINHFLYVSCVAVSPEVVSV